MSPNRLLANMVALVYPSWCAVPFLPRLLVAMIAVANIGRVMLYLTALTWFNRYVGHAMVGIVVSLASCSLIAESPAGRIAAHGVAKLRAMPSEAAASGAPDSNDQSARDSRPDPATTRGARIPGLGAARAALAAVVMVSADAALSAFQTPPARAGRLIPVKPLLINKTGRRRR
jgi:hypothetical protein